MSDHVDVDIPYVDDDVVRLSQDIRADLAERLRWNHFGFSQMVGMKDTTIKCHGPISVFLDHNPAQFKFILVPRDHLKTSHVTIAGCLQKVVQDPEHRIAIFNAVGRKAANMLLTIRSIAESNRVFRALYSSVIPQDTRMGRWNSDGLDFRREGSYQDPTISAYGMESTATSSHFTHQCWDDPIEEEAYKSPNVMADAITRMSGIQALMDTPYKDTVWVVGTRWALNDVYAHYMRVWAGRSAKLIRSVVENGEIIFPEKMGSFEDLAFKQSTMTPYRWSCWYMNAPRDESLQTFNTADVKFWAWGTNEETVVLRDKMGNIHRVVPFDKLDVTVTVDLAGAEKATDDRNAVVTTGVTPWGEAIVLDAWAERCTPMVVMEKLFELKRRFSPRVFGIEDVAYQKAFKWFLKTEADKRGVWFNVFPIKARGKKEVRIEGLQPLAATGRLWVHPKHFMLLQEAQEFPLGAHDDLIDALSMHQQLWLGIMHPDRWQKLKDAESAMVARIMGEPRRGVPPVDSFEKELVATLPSGWSPSARLAS